MNVAIKAQLLASVREVERLRRLAGQDHATNCAALVADVACDCWIKARFRDEVSRLRAEMEATVDGRTCALERADRIEKERDEARREVQKLRDELAAFAAAVALDLESRPQVADLDLSTQVEIPASLASERRTSERRASDRRESMDSRDGKSTARIAIPETMEDDVTGYASDANEAFVRWVTVEIWGIEGAPKLYRDHVAATSTPA